MSKYDKFEKATEALCLELPEKVAEHYVPIAAAMHEACKRKDGLLKKYKQNLVDFHCADCYDPKIFCVDSCCVGKLMREIDAELDREEI